MKKGKSILWMLPPSDLLLIVLIFMSGFWIRHSLLTGLMGTDFRLSIYHYLLSGLVLGSVQVVLMAMFEVYRKEFGLGMIEEVAGIIKAAVVAVLFTFTFTFVTRQLFFSRFVLVFSCPVSIVLLGLWHGCVRKLAARSGRPSRVLVLGNTEDAKRLGTFMEERAQLPYRIMEYAAPDLPVEEICALLETLEVDELVVAEQFMPDETLSGVILFCEKKGINYKIVADVFSLVSLTARVAHLGGTVLVESVPTPLSGWGYLLKRMSDVVISVLLLCLLSPVFLLTAVAIVLDSGLPVFYRQVRLGRDNCPFRMLKFRSMRRGAHKERESLLERNETSGPLFKIRKDPRITRVGRIIRRWSIDELPQLFNVLTGKMSLVGPRPPLPEEVEEYSRRDLKRLHTIPGVTGIWQISGRSNLSFDEMVKLDLYYVDNWSIWIDLAILLLTLPAVIQGGGAY